MSRADRAGAAVAQCCWGCLDARRSRSGGILAGQPRVVTSSFHPLKVETRVRTPLGLLKKKKALDPSGAFQRRDLLELVDETISLDFEVVAALKIHPEALGRTEVARHA